jgi:hypothetical protein
MTNASEQNRAGIMYAGQTSWNYYGANGAGASTVNTNVTGLPVSFRTPAQAVEVLWAPYEADLSFRSDDSAGGASTSQDTTGQSAITIGGVGLTAGTGVTVEMIGVYEVNWKAGLGYISSMPAPVTTSPWSAVLQGFYKLIDNAPVIVDTLRRTTEFVNTVGGSNLRYPGTQRRLLTNG